MRNTIDMMTKAGARFGMEEVKTSFSLLILAMLVVSIRRCSIELLAFCAASLREVSRPLGGYSNEHVGV